MKRFYFVESFYHSVLAETEDEARQLLQDYLDDDVDCENPERVEWLEGYNLERVYSSLRSAGFLKLPPF
jgi:hypothetical protein